MVCRRFSADDSIAKDMFQEGFIRIFKDLSQYDSAKGDLGAWMRKVMVNSCLQHIRKHKKWRATVEIAPGLHEDLSYMDTVLSDLSMQEIKDLIDQMPEGYRIVFNLYLIEGYSHKEIAEALDCSTSTSKSQLFKAKSWMRRKLLDLDPTLGLRYGQQVAQG